jgi:hypothetical protein
MKTTTIKALTLALCLISMTGVVSASAIGSFGYDTTGVLAFQISGQDFLDFCPANPGTPPANVPAGCGTTNNMNVLFGKGSIVAQPGTGDFATGPNTLAPNTPGTIVDITDAFPPAVPYQYLPPTSTTLPPGLWVGNFIVLTGHPNLNFTAQQLLLQQGPGCASIPNQQDCVGPFKLTQSNTPAPPPANVSTTVSIDVLGIVTDSNDGSTANFLDIITGQYAGLTIAQVEAAARTSNGIFSNTVSSSVITSPFSSVPEPTTASMFVVGAGLVLFSMLKPRRRTRS